MDARLKRYDTGFRALMVREVHESDRELSRIAREVKISPGTLAMWVALECRRSHRTSRRDPGAGYD